MVLRCTSNLLYLTLIISCKQTTSGSATNSKFSEWPAVARAHFALISLITLVTAFFNEKPLIRRNVHNLPNTKQLANEVGGGICR